MKKMIKTQTNGREPLTAIRNSGVYDTTSRYSMPGV